MAFNRDEFVWRGLALQEAGARVSLRRDLPAPLSHPISEWLDERPGEPDAGEGCSLRPCSPFAGRTEATGALHQPRSRCGGSMMTQETNHG